MQNITGDFGQMSNLLEVATGGVRKQLVPINLLDDTDDISLNEWEKRKHCQKLTQKDFEKVIELSPEDWIKIILLKNNEGLATTKLFKELFLFCQRTGLRWDWIPYDRGPYSKDVQKSLEKLETEKIISTETKRSHDKRIYKLREIKIKTDAEKLWKILPESFKEAIDNIICEFSTKTYDDMIHYVYSAYPEFAVLAKK